MDLLPPRRSFYWRNPMNTLAWLTLWLTVTGPAVASGDSGASKPLSVLEAPPPKQSLTAEVRGIVDRMQGFYEKTQDFTAQFVQVYRHQAFKRTKESSGQVTFKKPGFMRWEYEKPAPKTFVLANEKVYALDPQALTLTKGSMASHELSASVTFLWGRGKLTDEFNIRKVDCTQCQGVLLELTPLRPDPRFQRILFDVDAATSQVHRSIVVDPDGSENEIRFAGLKRNVGVSQDRFQISPPPGTQTVDLTRAKK
jgi:outer membrane lipoprotein carrier protein